MNYKFWARSKSDPNGDKGGLGYSTQESAQKHADCMNLLIETYETSPIWNKEFWKSKPEPWFIFKK